MKKELKNLLAKKEGIFTDNSIRFILGEIKNSRRPKVLVRQICRELENNKAYNCVLPLCEILQEQGILVESCLMCRNWRFDKRGMVLRVVGRDCKPKFNATGVLVTGSDYCNKFAPKDIE